MQLDLSQRPFDRQKLGVCALERLICPQNFELSIEREIFAQNSCRASETRSCLSFLVLSAIRIYRVIISAMIRQPLLVISFLELTKTLSHRILALYSCKPWAGRCSLCSDSSIDLYFGYTDRGKRSQFMISLHYSYLYYSYFAENCCLATTIVWC